MVDADKWVDKVPPSSLRGREYFLEYYKITRFCAAQTAVPQRTHVTLKRQMLSRCFWQRKGKSPDHAHDFGYVWGEFEVVDVFAPSF